MRAATAALATASIVGTLLALEAATRVVLPDDDRARVARVGLPRETQNRLAWIERQSHTDAEWLGFHRHDPLLGWRPRPDVRTRVVKPGSYDAEVTTNGAGLRMAYEVADAKPPGRQRIALFGCSQTFGLGVDDDQTYGARLAAALPGVEVLNFGVVGYGTDQMLLSLERDGLALEPDVVVLAFAPYHVWRNVQSFRFFAKPRFTLGADGALGLVGVPVPAPSEVLDADAPASWPMADRSLLLRWVWHHELARREHALLADDTEAWHLTQILVGRFAERVSAAAATMVLVNVDDTRHRPLAPAVSRLAEDLGIHFVDVVPALSDAARSRPIRLPDDPHYDADGHDVIAAGLADYLCRHDLVRGCPPSPADGEEA